MANHSHRDLFTKAIYKTLMASTAMTASKTDAAVLDLRDYKPGSVAGFLVFCVASTTADASNYFTFKLFEAAEKTSSTALTSGTVVADDDVLGVTEDGVLVSGPFPVINATTEVGVTYWFAYRGYKPCLQIQPTETGTASVTASIIAVISTGAIENVKADVVV